VDGTLDCSWTFFAFIGSRLPVFANQTFVESADNGLLRGLAHPEIDLAAGDRAVYDAMKSLADVCNNMLGVRNDALCVAVATAHVYILHPIWIIGSPQLLRWASDMLALADWHNLRRDTVRPTAHRGAARTVGPLVTIPLADPQGSRQEGWGSSQIRPCRTWRYFR